MQKFVFGVQSDSPANTRLTNGYTLFDWVVRQNCFPAYWGRSVSGKTAITKAEIDFLADRDCGVLLVFDDITAVDVAKKDGTKDAERAISAVEKLGIEGDGQIAIFAEIKDNMNVNHNWMLSFASKLIVNGYMAGFIGNTDSSDNFNFDSEYSHYLRAGGIGVCISTKPQTNEHVYDWTPYSPSALPVADVAFWRNGKKEFMGISYNTIYSKDASPLENIYVKKTEK